MSPGKRRNLRDRARAADAMRAACGRSACTTSRSGRCATSGRASRAARSRPASPRRRTDGERNLCALLPQEGGFARDVERERRLTAFLAELELPLRVPRLALSKLGVVEQDGERILVRESLDGFPADLRAGAVGPGRPRRRRDPPHPTEDLGWLPGHATCRAQGEHRIAELAPLSTGAAEVRDALAWMRAHLPPDERSRLLQGDLLGQNVLLARAPRVTIARWPRCCAACRGERGRTYAAPVG